MSASTRQRIGTLFFSERVNSKYCDAVDIEKRKSQRAWLLLVSWYYLEYISRIHFFLFLFLSFSSALSVTIPLHLEGVFFPSFPKERHSSVPCCIVHAQPPICSAHSAAASETSRWLKRQIALTKKKKKGREKKWKEGRKA